VEAGVVHRLQKLRRDPPIERNNAHQSTTVVAPKLNLFAAYLLVCSLLIFGIGWYFLKHQSMSYFQGNKPSNGQRLFMGWFSLMSSCLVLVAAIREFRKR
jgi:hypothetical protein